MAFTLILGPMKSGKSLELIARIAPYEFAGKKVLYAQPNHNVRDDGVVSRSGLKVKAIKVTTLTEIPKGFDVIGIDEINMFAEGDARQVFDWLNDNKEVVVSGLDLSYKAELIPIIARLLELKPDTIISKLAVCEVCLNYEAKFTQILHKGEPLLGGISIISPEDGTYVYEPRCRSCYVRP